MRHRVLIAVGTIWMAASAPHVLADRVHLVGGAVIEGKATRQGDKVVVEVESGEVALPASDVQRIEVSESDVERADVMFAKIAPRDLDGLFEFANFCRDHGMAGRERMALQRVIDVAPDNEQARARLGFVRADGTWIKREDQLRAQGLVEYEGKWITRADMLQLERMRAETETARLTRDKAQAEARKAEAEADDARAKQATPPVPPAVVATTTTPAYATYAWPAAYPPPYAYPVGAGGGRVRCAHGRRGGCFDEPAPSRSTHAAFPIPGAKDPFDYFR
jgi:hypothetical protein